ncbi:MAG: hypothetical protein GY797_26230 [Deltaproteobacteria bacterium]|nr:hypothetical protein [Deltaproteobacteria bacterium]
MKNYSAELKKAMRRINSGRGDLEKDWKEYRHLQAEFAEHLLAFAVNTVGEKKVLEIPRTILRLLAAKDFPQGTIIRTGKYRIDCNGLKTRVEDTNTWKTLNSSQTPLYLKEFGTA